MMNERLLPQVMLTQPLCGFQFHCVDFRHAGQGVQKSV